MLAKCSFIKPDTCYFRKTDQINVTFKKHNYYTSIISYFMGKHKKAYFLISDKRCVLLCINIMHNLFWNINYIFQNTVICIFSQNKTSEGISIETKNYVRWFTARHIKYIWFFFFLIFYITWKILASHTRLWVRRKLPLKVLSLQNMNKKNSSRRVYIPIRVHLRQNRVHWKAEGKIKERKAQVRHALDNTACILTAMCATRKRKATSIRYLLISF